MSTTNIVELFEEMPPEAREVLRACVVREYDNPRDIFTEEGIGILNYLYARLIEYPECKEVYDLCIGCRSRSPEIGSYCLQCVRDHNDKL